MRLIVVMALTALAACTHTTNADRCASYGYSVGTEPYANCLERIDTADRARRSNAAILMGLGMQNQGAAMAAQPYVMPVPKQTYCQNFGGMVHCSTY